MANKYIKLNHSAGSPLDEEWAKAAPPVITGIGSHANVPGALTVKLPEGKTLKFALRKNKEGEFLLGFDA